eukprot:8842105-Heterocapsa_arctica.AAC.1
MRRALGAHAALGNTAAPGARKDPQPRGRGIGNPVHMARALLVGLPSSLGTGHALLRPNRT